MRMTVNEIKEFVQNLRHRVEILVNRGWAIDGLINDYTKSADTIEKLLEEVIELAQIAAMQMKLKEYKSIGTIEEFKVLKDKAEPKKAIFDNEDGWEAYICPSCGKTVGEHQNYCWNCGQAFET